jgi:hypothetical protein
VTDHATSRRALLRRAALGLGAAAALAPAARAQQQPKVPQADAKYQARPKGQQRCEICLQFRPPASCQLVGGTISRTGWCQFFAARENAH